MKPRTGWCAPRCCAVLQFVCAPEQFVLIDTQLGDPAGLLTMNSTSHDTAAYFGGIGGASFGASSVAIRRNNVSASLE
jgi:hypothetical protein